MTRKDYIAIANAIRSTNDRIRSQLEERISATQPRAVITAQAADLQLRGVRRAAAALADALADDNPCGFDAQVFLRNCGYGGEVRATQPVQRSRYEADETPVD